MEGAEPRIMEGAAASSPPAGSSGRQGALRGAAGAARGGGQSGAAGAARGGGSEQSGAARRPKMAAQAVNVAELPLPQLELLKGQLDQLKVVQTKYVEAKDCLNVLNKSNEGKDLLVPLTSSMYVPGKLSDVERVLIDIGTGYYVEKTADDARDFFKRKIDFLTKQMEKIQPALQEKHAMKQAVVEMMSQKIQQLTAPGAAQGATAKA
ncbi:prefoldin subunit 5 isoform X2 [Patagioenas fasciata]|uniref:prefoldin subunit 5 isoform X2 n=1 Tax=Patagioenas fasciata TaxID=372321 RepID=UPI003A996315